MSRKVWPHEIATLYDALYEAMQTYADEVSGTSIVYDANAYPYMLKEDGSAYNAFTPRLVQAAYNLHYVTKDPGAFAHNGKYIIQVLYDGLESLGQVVEVDMTGLVRPESE